jgi:hypothetical protein
LAAVGTINRESVHPATIVHAVQETSRRIVEGVRPQDSPSR